MLFRSAQPGALGGNVIKWTNVAILKEAQKYKSVKEWFTKSPQSYVAASTKKLIRSASRNMVREIRRPGSWTKKDVRLSAQKFSSFKEWIDKDRKSYGAAQRLGLLNNKSIVGHLSKRLMPARKWTASSIKSEGGKYKSRAEWKRRSSGSYKAAKRCGLFDEIVSRMQRPAVQKKWTIQTILAEAKKHKTRAAWRKVEAGSYSAAIRLGCLAEATKKMKVLNQKGKWNKQAVMRDARRYQYRSEWEIGRAHV